MLNFVYYPVSAILWVWHKVFGFLFGPDQGITWVLAVIFLVFTLRLLLYRPFVKQVRTTRQMQELQPQIKALQKKYGKDKQRLALEMQKLQKEHGFNPLMGCLPVLVQVPVFIGLFQVLRSFNRTGTGWGQLGMSPEANASTANYVFSATDVQSFLNARIFNVPLSAYITMDEGYAKAFNVESLGIHGGTPSMTALILVAVPIMLLASIATHLNSRFSIARQSAAVAANPQTAIMNKLALYVFPIGVLVGGPFLPIAILIYWVANNVWTYGQQHVVYRKMDAEEEAKKAAVLEKRSDLAPRPGAKPRANLTKELTAPESAEFVDDSDSTSAVPKKNPNRAGGGKRPGQVKNRKNNPNRGRANQGPKKRP